MAFNIHGKNLNTLLNMTQEQLEFLLDLSEDLKKAKYDGSEEPKLKGKNIVLIFEKPSTRTRCSFEIAAHDQGAHTTYLGTSDTHIGSTESIKDTARVLGRLFDAIEFRGFKQSNFEILEQFSGVPTWNGLTNEYHPTQILADLLTMKEHGFDDLRKVSFCFLGDAGNNMGNSLMIGAAKMGMDFRMACPDACKPEQSLIDECLKIAKDSGAKITITSDVEKAVKGCDFLYTDVWVSMGDPDTIWQQRIKELLPFQVNEKVMKMTGKPDCYFMHCLPSFHNRDTIKGEEIYKKFGLSALEVTDEVFESKHSIVFQQAENRMHTIKAVMVSTLGD